MSSVVVLAGGTSGEREISLRSGAAIAQALQQKGHQVKTLDPAGGLDGLLQQLKQADVVFPALHGEGGEDGVLQRFLEEYGICYVGPDSRASAVCFDKARYAELLRNHGVTVPADELVGFEEYRKSSLADKPFVLKPNDGGSSIDTFIVRDPETVNNSAVKEAFARHPKLLLQELIEGDEITVAMLGDEPLPVIEIIPPKGGEFDYENKYNGQTMELCPPKHVNQSIQAQAQILAQKIHRLTGCRDMSRTDIIVTPTEALYVLETNTIPGLTGESLLPKAAGKAGYDMPDLCDKLIEMARGHNT